MFHGTASHGSTKVIIIFEPWAANVKRGIEKDGILLVVFIEAGRPEGP
jgi:hypothetical protein